MRDSYLGERGRVDCPPELLLGLSRELHADVPVVGDAVHPALPANFAFEIPAIIFASFHELPAHQIGHLGVELPVALLQPLQGLQVGNRHLHSLTHLEVLLCGGKRGRGW